MRVGAVVVGGSWTSVSIQRHAREHHYRHRPHGPRCVPTDIPRNQPDRVGSEEHIMKRMGIPGAL